MKVERHWLICCFLMRRRFSCRSKTVSLCGAAIICTTLSILCCSAPISAQETEILPLCPTGSHLSPSSAEKCLACKAGATYMDRLNRENACYPCTKCDSLMVQVTPCSVTADAHCECHEGYFKNVEGKCSPKLTSPPASTDRPSLKSKPVVDSSSSTDTTGHKLNIIIGIMATAAVMFAIYIIVKIIFLCRQQKRTRACTLGCTGTDRGDKKTNGFHSKEPRDYKQPGQVAEEEKLLDQTLHPAAGPPSRQLGTNASAEHKDGLDATKSKDRNLSATAIQARGEQTSPGKFETGNYVVAMGKVEADKRESSEMLSVLGNSTISSGPMMVGPTQTSV